MAKKEKTENPSQKEEKNEPAEKAEDKKNEGEEQKEKKTEETECETLKKQLDKKSDDLLRLAAEYDNYRKRTAREKDELYASVKSTVISEFLPITDNLERALGNKTENIEDYKKGVEMIAKQFADVFTKLGVTEFGEVGDAFDPNQYNAVMHIEDESLGENVVSAVFAKGYKAGDKVIRHAMVQVAN
ncbi:MAG: nucleotide exchange factor GrpE [Clostridiales bacterium]|nr:nucleotide exchange factor GrpE [Clostridiales bacterium]